MLQATPTNFAQINKAIGLVLPGAQTLRDKLAADAEKYLIVRTSDLVWKLMSNMEVLEDQVGRKSMTTLRAQEKAYVAHQAAVDILNKTPYSGGGGGKFQGKGKAGGKGKGKGKEKGA